MSGWAWLGLAALLGLAELVVPGVFLVFVAAAAALTGLLTLASPDATLAVQLGGFALSSVAAVLIGRRLYHATALGNADPLLNARIERLIGAIVTVEQAIIDGRGRVRVGDGAWPAIGPDLPIDAKVRVIGHDDGVLVVETIARTGA